MAGFLLVIFQSASCCFLHVMALSLTIFIFVPYIENLKGWISQTVFHDPLTYFLQNHLFSFFQQDLVTKRFWLKTVTRWSEILKLLLHFWYAGFNLTKTSIGIGCSVSQCHDETFLVVTMISMNCFQSLLWLKIKSELFSNCRSSSASKKKKKIFNWYFQIIKESE